RFPNNTLEEVSLPVNATPSQPSIGEKKGNKTPVLANANPIVASSPPKRVVNPNASIAAIVNSDKRTRFSVDRNVRKRVAGPRPSSSPEIMPDRSNAVPVAESQLRVNTAAAARGVATTGGGRRTALSR